MREGKRSQYTALYCAVTYLMTNCWNAKAHPALLKSSGEAPFRNNTVAASGTTNTRNPVITKGVCVSMCCICICRKREEV